MSEHRAGPSHAGQWVLAVLGLIGTGVQLGVMAYTGPEDVYSAAVRTAAELRQEHWSYGGFDVWDALRAGNPDEGFGSTSASDLDLRAAGEDGRGRLYEITREDGEYPVCLVVSYDSDPFGQATSTADAAVDEGPC